MTRPSADSAAGVKRKKVLSLHSGKQEHRQRIECESEAPSCRRANDPESQS
jgi:hypothetical protein